MNLASHPETLERDIAAIRVHPDDDVAVALQAIEIGEIVEVAEAKVAARDSIGTGHKIALRDLGAGEMVRKFGWPIGRTRMPIAAGAHIHTHNLQTLLSGLEGYCYDGPAATPSLPSAGSQSFFGCVRDDGRVGTRNEVWILPTVGCVARTAERIAAIARERHADSVDGVYAFSHPFGC